MWARQSIPFNRFMPFICLPKPLTGLARRANRGLDPGLVYSWDATRQQLAWQTREQDLGHWRWDFTTLRYRYLPGPKPAKGQYRVDNLDLLGGWLYLRNADDRFLRPAWHQRRRWRPLLRPMTMLRCWAAQSKRTVSNLMVLRAMV